MNIHTPKSPRWAAAALATSICTLAIAQPTPTPTLTTDQPVSDTLKDGSLSHHDRAFLKMAAGAGMKEIDISRAVEDRLTNVHARDFAQMMITDHTAANEELMTLASNKGVKLPPEDASIGDDWSKKGGDLDHKYVKEMVSDHLDAVKLFENAAGSADADVAAFAQKTLPTLQHHLALAQELARDVN